MLKLIFSVLFMASTFSAYAGVVVIANNDVGVDSLAKKDAKGIFLGKKKKWADGKKATIVVQKKGDTHNEFIKGTVGKSASQYKTYWKKLIFTGKGKQPKTVKSDADVLAFVARTSGAVGYVTEGSATDGVKVIAIK